jgi:lipoprotein NlpD
MSLKYIMMVTVCVMGASGCYNHRQDAAPVVQYAVKLSDIPDVYKVKSGDSLYTIAWQYDLDFRTIAANNGLRSPDQIDSGQILHLRGKSPKVKARVVQGKRPPKAKKSKQAPSVVAITSRTQHQQKAISQPSKKPAQVQHNTQTDNVAVTQQWLKPVAGSIIKRYSSKEEDFNKGLDFSGRMNDKVLAAQAGKVVYSGAGLRGYGKLIIIKHNEMYLSAYAHNNKLLVTEGDVVQQGQQIAKMGNTDSKQIKLHFQIRKNGQPVDPSRYL